MRTDILHLSFLALTAAVLLSACGSDTIPRGETSPEMASALEAYIEEAAQDDLDINTIMVMQHGKVIAEAYINGWTADDPHQMWSVSKTYTAFAVGFAIQEGLLSLDDKIVDLLPEETSAVLDTLTNEAWAENMRAGTVRDYLVMGTGQTIDALDAQVVANELWHLNGTDSLDFYIQNAGVDLVKGFFTYPFEHAPGTFNYYNSGASFILSVIVQKLTGERVVDYLGPRLFEPLGIEQPHWQVLNGRSVGGWGLYLKPEDMAKTGLMMLGDGCYNGRRILPEGYMEQASKKFFSWDKPSWCAPEEGRYYATGYGWQMWQNTDSFFASGHQGQYIFVFPQYDAVVVTTAEVENGGDYKEAALIWDHILPVLAKSAE